MMILPKVNFLEHTPSAVLRIDKSNFLLFVAAIFGFMEQAESQPHCYAAKGYFAL